MIRMQLPWLVFTGLLIFLAGILLVWIGYEIARRHRERGKLRHWIQCPVCSLQYRAAPSTPLTRCPQCNSLNEHIPVRIF
jgi:hypothetical protein